jgi:hypothetical protein
MALPLVGVRCLIIETDYNQFRVVRSATKVRISDNRGVIWIMPQGNLDFFFLIQGISGILLQEVELSPEERIWRQNQIEKR